MKRRRVYPHLINHAPPGSFLTGPSLFFTVPSLPSLRGCPFATVPSLLSHWRLSLRYWRLTLHYWRLTLRYWRLTLRYWRRHALAHHATYRATVHCLGRAEHCNSRSAQLHHYCTCRLHRTHSSHAGPDDFRRTGKFPVSERTVCD